jgi:hypothetical protein
VPVIPGRCEASSQESITTDACDGLDVYHRILYRHLVVVIGRAPIGASRNDEGLICEIGDT